jgi:Domain of unknown function (DUF4129)
VTGAAEARRQAASILHESRYRGSSVPRPLHGALETIGDGLRSLGHAITNVVDDLAGVLPGGTAVAWTVVGLLVLAATVVVGRLAARTVATDRGRRASAAAAPTLSADQLRARAEEAERGGDYALALRLRFRAGLVELADRDLVRSPALLTSGELSRRLSSADFDALAGRFDEVAYGGRPAAADDVADARARWGELLKGRA